MLVIAYGNPLRQDDGAGWAVGAALALRPGVEVLSVHQLLPELAEFLMHEPTVVFVDARRDGTPGEVRGELVSPRDVSWNGSHGLDPGVLLGLCRRLYGDAPEAFLITIAGERFGFGSDLSDPVRRAVPEAVRRVLGTHTHRPSWAS